MALEQITETMTAHPMAEIFPMLSDDDLQDLAEDIKANGLLHPIVVDAEGQILDGRNRYSACQLAGVEPRYEEYEGEVDPGQYALSVNIARRHLSKGQTAMIQIKARLLDSSKKSQQAIASESGVSQQRLSFAAIVQKHAPDLVDRVVSGHVMLDKAYEAARANKAEEEETAARIAELAAYNKDLEDRVIAEELDLGEALKIAAEREVEREREAARQRVRVSDISQALASTMRYCNEVLEWEGSRQSIKELFDNSQSQSPFGVNLETIEKAISNLTLLGDIWDDPSN